MKKPGFFNYTPSEKPNTIDDGKSYASDKAVVLGPLDSDKPGNGQDPDFSKKRGRPAKSGLSLKDRLSRLNFTEAAKLLGADGKVLLKSKLASSSAVSMDSFAFLGEDEFRIGVNGVDLLFFLLPESGLVDYRCPLCPSERGHGCEHAAAALAFILEEKMTLGLAAPPPERVPLEMLSEAALVERAVNERRERVETDNLKVSLVPEKGVWGDYQVDNPKSGKSYKVSVRGLEKGKIFCECPDFRSNTLGLCKHTLCVEGYLNGKGKKPERLAPWEPEQVEVFLDYSKRPLNLRVIAPKDLSFLDKKAIKRLEPYLEGPVEDLLGLIRALSFMGKRGLPFFVYPDALEHIQQRLHRKRMSKITQEIRDDPINHPLRKSLLKVELLPYQLDGVAFAAGAGRAIIADEMGLGKTIQGVGLAEFLAINAGVKKVLVICPASLKSQWEDEIKRFSDRTASQVLGSARERILQYSGDTFFTICNYEQIPRDKRYVMDTPWDLIILDEAQRIKNWETKAHRAISDLKSRYLLILTGTPLENSLDELYTLVKLVDIEVFGPAFRFLNAHKETDEKGKLLAWRGLNDVKSALSPVFLRRTRQKVMSELPPRQTEIIRIPPTQEQLDEHAVHLRAVSQIVRKPYFTEIDFLRLQKHLLMCRLAANSTALIYKNMPGHSSKLDELWELLGGLLAERDRKIILFSEWTTMLGLVEERLSEWGQKFVRLDGKVPQQKRKFLVRSFSDDPEVRFFLASNAGSTGLNLQAADTIVNLDLPWNPAILEQRIGRAHRIGQKKCVQVYLLVTQDTIEERLLGLLGAKSELSLASLDLESDVDFVEMSSGIDALKSRLEILLGQRPDKEPEPEAPEASSASSSGRSQQGRREKITESGGRLLTALFDFLGELAPREEAPEDLPAPKTGHDAQEGQVAANNRKPSLIDSLGEILNNSFEKDEEGRARLTITLPDENVIQKAAEGLRSLLGRFL